jgi:hypothetical protein
MAQTIALAADGLRHVSQKSHNFQADARPGGPPGQRQKRSLHYLRARRKAQVTMVPEPYLPVLGHPQERSAPDRVAAAGPAEERKLCPARG